MAVKLRLVRMGKKKQPTYRVVAADSRSPRDGRFLEVVGTYAPRGRSSTDAETIITIDHEKALRWLRQGAKPTERVERLLRSSGTLDRLAGGTGEVTATPATSATAKTAPAETAPAKTAPAETAAAETAPAETAPAESAAAPAAEQPAARADEKAGEQTAEVTGPDSVSA